MTTWFTSDLHLGHKNIIKYCRRPFALDMDNPTRAEVTAMNACLVDNWNSAVGAGDDVYMLGDFAVFTTYQIAVDAWMALRGHKHAVHGNHEEQLNAVHGRFPHSFASWQTRAEVTLAGQAIVMHHYAQRSWQGDLAGAWHLFGHTHAALGPYGKSVDVGVDNAHNVLGVAKSAVTHRPICFAELKRYLDARPVGDHAAFGGARQGG